MNIYIEFTEPVGKKFPVYSWIIKATQKTKYSHVRLRWKSTSGVEIIYEASGRSVKVIGEEAQDHHKVSVIDSYEIEVSPEEYKKLIRLFRYASVDYGVLQAIGIGIATAFNLDKNPFSKGRKSQVCSELVGLFLEEVKNWSICYNLDLAGPKEIQVQLDKYINRNYPGIKKVL